MSVQLKRWTRDEYDRLVALGVLSPGNRVQLIEGDIVEMAPQKAGHAAAITLAGEVLRRLFPAGHIVRVQLPLALGAFSEPEPDVAVVAGDPRAYRDRHPSTAILVVEISDETLAFDRTRKAEVYAATGVPEYWVLNLLDRFLEVFRDPVPADDGRHAYRTLLLLSAGEHVALLARPDHQIPVADLLP